MQYSNPEADSTNVMLLSPARKLNSIEFSSTNICLQMVDGSVICPKGINENMLMRIGRLIFPIDFGVLEMDRRT